MKYHCFFAFLLVTMHTTLAIAQTQKTCLPAPVETSTSFQDSTAPCSFCPCPKTFEGFFVGGNIGYGVGYASVNNNLLDFSNTTQSQGYRGVDGGINVGYQHRFGNIALGLEGVFNWAHATGTERTTNADNGTFKNSITQENDIQVRVPVSYVICNLLAPKILLGWDNASLKKKSSGDLPPFSGRYNGFLWGMGVDALVVENVLAGLEYTGVIYNGKKTVDADGDSASVSPQYNKFAFTLKYLF